VTTHSTEPLLLARGFLVGGLVAVVAETPPVLLERTIAAVYNKDPDMEIPQVAAMKAFTDYVQGQRVPADMQAPMINAIAGFLDGRELDDFEGADDLNVTVAEALRSIISVDVKVVLRDDVPAIALLFSITRYGAAYFQTMLIINEAFEEIVLGIVDAGLYASLCERVLPSMTAVYDAADLSKDDDLVTVGVVIFRFSCQVLTTTPSPSPSCLSTLSSTAPSRSRSALSPPRSPASASCSWWLPRARCCARAQSASSTC
jgi:hypothetical protein